MSEVTRHFTATTFVVSGERVLLHRHPKQGLWLPPGGHIERDELPHDAARREMEEETGLRLPLHSAAEAEAMSAEMDVVVVPQPAFVLVENINPYHQHIDFIYFALASGAGEPLPAVARANGFTWLTPSELEGMDGVPVNVIAGARRAVTHFASGAAGEPASAVLDGA